MLAYFHNAHSTTQIVMFGDSLVAGYGLAKSDALPSKLEKYLLSQGKDATIENGGISGDTTEDALERVKDMMNPKPDIVIIVLGGNDMLRGFDPKIIYENLEKIITQFKAAKIQVVLTKMKSSLNYGLAYKSKFDEVYDKLIKKHSIESLPFFMEYVLTDQSLMLSDGVHPSARGVDLIVEKIGPMVIKFIK